MPLLRMGFAPRERVTLVMLSAFQFRLSGFLLAPVIASLLAALSLVALPRNCAASEPSRSLILVTGAAGEEPFGEQFQESAKAWQELAEKQNWQLTWIGQTVDQTSSDHERLQQAITTAAEAAAEHELWIVLIGHGTFSNNSAKFNLVGRDVSATELNVWLKPVRGRTVIINCSSSSAPFLTTLAANNRIVVTATRSGSEQNFARFGKYLAQSLRDLSADLDHDREISLLEVFLAASSQTERFYREEARLATEHGLLDDNGDRVGTGSEFFRGVRPAKEPEEGKQVDGRVAAQAILFSAPDAIQLTAEQQAVRLRIENQLDALRVQKSQLNEEAYLEQLEKVLLDLARLYEKAS